MNVGPGRQQRVAFTHEGLIVAPLISLTGVFSMPWEVVVQVFDAAYLNWDPSMFGTAVAVHSCVALAMLLASPSSADLAASPLALQNLADQTLRHGLLDQSRCAFGRPPLHHM
jgi:hypothetical protein